MLQSCIKRWNREPSSQKDFTIFKFSQKLFAKAYVENHIKCKKIYNYSIIIKNIYISLIKVLHLSILEQNISRIVYLNTVK